MVPFYFSVIKGFKKRTPEVLGTVHILIQIRMGGGVEPYMYMPEVIFQKIKHYTCRSNANNVSWSGKKSSKNKARSTIQSKMGKAHNGK